MNVHRIYRGLSPYFRRRRHRRFVQSLGPGPADRILDIGGTVDFWANFDFPKPVTLLNRSRELAGITDDCPGCTFLEGDGCELPLPSCAFEIVFSNSAIEHVGSWERQQAFAREVRRVGRRLWVQTPAREFFFEPHFLTPFIHWLPRSWQRRMLRNFTLRGWLERDNAAALEELHKEVRLLSHAEMQILFPDCLIVEERFLGFAKSHIAIRPAPQ